MRDRNTRMLTLRLDIKEDADLLAWIDCQPEGARSAAIRQALRAGLGMTDPQPNTADLSAIRAVVAEELVKALAGRQLAVSPEPAAQAETSDAEARFGSKLDRMMGGLLKSNASPGETDEPDETRLNGQNG